MPTLEIIAPQIAGCVFCGERRMTVRDEGNEICARCHAEQIRDTFADYTDAVALHGGDSHAAQELAETVQYAAAERLAVTNGRPVKFGQIVCHGCAGERTVDPAGSVCERCDGSGRHAGFGF